MVAASERQADRTPRRRGAAVIRVRVDRARTPPPAATGQPDDRSGERQRRGERRDGERPSPSGWGLAVAGSPPLPPRCHLLILNYAIFISCDHIC
ncbi:hypothetical protein EE612_047036 [Oryza sativa]|nr:hypothetical protein EE612_047036 [Oryza sativa]